MNNDETTPKPDSPQRAYAKRNPEKVKAWARAAYARNREKIRARKRAAYRVDIEKSRALGRAANMRRPAEVKAAYQKKYQAENRETIRAKAKVYQVENKEAIAQKAAAYRKANIEKVRAKRKAYYQENKERLKQEAKAYRAADKAAVFAHYGQECVCCGESHPKALALDHVNGDGAAHRKAIGLKRRAGWNFYWFLRKAGFPNNPPLQVLCHTCNWSKGTGDTCPVHEKYLGS